jgi:heme/copper-type cytochrome/quinol oxidase subunit 2
MEDSCLLWLAQSSILTKVFNYSCAHVLSPPPEPSLREEAKIISMNDFTLIVTLIVTLLVTLLVILCIQVMALLKNRYRDNIVITVNALEL